ncbi:hypothetical protein TRFO_12732 [Tritrichomonas foetus]|uniref:Uncharacterized protein n=1 Tax=Tritrichomonas foetus TaxID=1144522 RepID=A0A1J4L1T3_9EUKA|nr:hypothetical protein TRFO_12732 [Tritrichomonas foetus]|eukprot:OHT17032.1 hypothetical protein TRFO_12732 [Tritrichomonas foetus]
MNVIISSLKKLTIYFTSISPIKEYAKSTKFEQMEEKVVFPDPFSYPLFVDSGVSIICMGCFPWSFSSNYFSYFPIIVQPPNFPNLFVSMCSFDFNYLKGENGFININEFKNGENKAIIEKSESLAYFFQNCCPEKAEKINFCSIANFNPYTYKFSEEEVTFLYFNTQNIKTSHGKLGGALFDHISTTILNPLGIGLFFSKQAPFVILTGEKPKSENCTFVQAPYSMEIVEKLLYNPSIVDENSQIQNDLNLTDSISLKCLKYPLRKLYLPSYDISKIRDKTIFSLLHLPHPPNIDIDVLPDFNYNNEKLISAYKWIFIKLKFKPINQVFVVITKDQNNNNSDKEKHYLNLYPWEENGNAVILPIKGKKAAIYAPFDGYLELLGGDESSILYMKEF